MRRFFVLCMLIASPLGAAVASADTVGQSTRFKVNVSYDAEGDDSVGATLRAVGDRGYFYVDDRTWDALTSSQRPTFTTRLQELADEFDAVIYPRAVALWGSEATPGVDGDRHVTVLLQKLVSGSGGYFETIHNYAREQTDEGNIREMVFVNADGVTSGFAKRFLAHEFQHLISFNQRELLLRMEEDLWLNEGRSEYTVTAVGYSEPFEGSTLQRRSQTFVREAGDSLTDWPNTTTDYAMTSMFVHYLAGRYGSAVLADTLHMSFTGTDAIDRWLVARWPERFGDVFTDWMVASYLNDGSSDPTYAYTQRGLESLRVTPIDAGGLRGADDRISFDDRLIEWEPLWVSADVQDANEAAYAVIHVEGDAGSAVHGAVIAEYGGQEQVTEFNAAGGITDVAIPTSSDGEELSRVVVAVAHGSVAAVEGRVIADSDIELTLSLSDEAPTPVPSVPRPSTGALLNGDLIRRAGQPDIYVVWGPYRRLLPPGVLELYGFQDRPIHEVTDDVFFGYQASVYIRSESDTKVFSAWSDGTKHWINITPAQWDASFRDWGAIFTVNDAEVAWYTTGPDITR